LEERRKEKMDEITERNLLVLKEEMEEGFEAMEKKMAETEEDYERRWRDINARIWGLYRKVKRLEKRNLRREENLTISGIALLLGMMMVWTSFPQPPIIKTCWWGLVLGGCIFIGGLWGFLKEMWGKWK
jgi:hypothetical protein